MSAQLKQSQKVSLIDRKTYEKLQQQRGSTSSNKPQRPIRNAKYKKTRAVAGADDSGAFNLLQFLIEKPKERQQLRKKQKHVVRLLTTASAKQTWKKRGKTREGGSRKKHSRLKKSILHYRQLKREQQQRQRQYARMVDESVEQLRELTISQTTTTTTTEEVLPTSTNSQPAVHSRRFRTYCDNCTTPLLGQLTEQLLRELDRFQKRAYAHNEIKARAHRRLVFGFREVQNFLRINKVKLVIMAPDCEECHGEAGIDETIESIKCHCQSQQIPYVFALRRRQLAYALYKKVPISCVAVLDYDGARELFGQVLEAMQAARQAYTALTLPSEVAVKAAETI